MDVRSILQMAQYTVLQRAGIAVRPEQIGLKPDRLPSPFQRFLGVSPAAAGSINALPEPPTAPEDPSDPEAQKAFNEAMLTYNQQLQAYNQRFFSLMMLQMQQALRFQAPAAQPPIPRGSSFAASASVSPADESLL